MALRKPDGWGFWWCWTLEKGDSHSWFPRPRVIVVFSLSPNEEPIAIHGPPALSIELLARVSRVISSRQSHSEEKQIYFFIPGRWLLIEWLKKICQGRIRRSLWSVLCQFQAEITVVPLGRKARRR